MKIKRITLKNVTSYKEETTFQFDERLNILIGPNGGGKSNLQKILAVVLSNYFIHQYDFRIDDKEPRIEQVDLWTRRVLQRNLDRFFDDKSDQIISIDLVPEESDVRNIKLIAENLGEFNEQLELWESPRDSYPPIDYVDEIADADYFTYRIVNLELEDLTKDNAASAFREYLRTFFIFMRLSSRIPEISLTAPVFFFFSERTAGRNISVQTSQITEQNYYSGYRNVYQAAMGENTNLFQWGMQHFVKKWWKALNEAGNRKGATAHNIFSKDPDVVLLDKYLTKLGYDWGIATDLDSVTYSIALKKGDHTVTTEKFSSGEREIVHFLLAMFSLNVKDGVILVDEPELHLHPRWQRVFLELFRELSPDRNNQFVITTHSPVFVTQDTINSITRIYRSQNSSKKVSLGDVDLPEKKNLVRMINSQNNERIFFADKVILVEGITDRIVISSLIDGAAARFLNNEAVEVIEVGGKYNFEQYRALLESLKTPSFIVADRDYLWEAGSEATKGLFVSDAAKVWKALATDKKSFDLKSFLASLEDAIHEAKIDELRSVWRYLKSRHRRLKEPLSVDQSRILQQDIENLKKVSKWVLSAGDIEDYLPDGFAKLGDLVALVQDRNWIVRVELETRRMELVDMTCVILGATEEQTKQLREDASARKQLFPALLV